ncbi:hypothetical protein LP420_14530 [Massilia sp. B-10]|nr:hypothetical protein LP420_14530 [Massilia sp. B-10]
MNNLADRQYVGSLIIGDANKRFYEAALKTQLDGGRERAVRVQLRMTAPARKRGCRMYQ